MDSWPRSSRGARHRSQRARARPARHAPADARAALDAAFHRRVLLGLRAASPRHGPARRGLPQRMEVIYNRRRRRALRTLRPRRRASRAGRRGGRDRDWQRRPVGVGEELRAARARLRPARGHGDAPGVHRRGAGAAAAGSCGRELWCLGARVLLGHRDDVASLLSGLDVFVLPSLSEGMSNTLLEAMAAGVARPLPAMSGNGEIIVDKQTGLLFASGDEAALHARTGDAGGRPARRAQLATPGKSRAIGSSAWARWSAGTNRCTSGSRGRGSLGRIDRFLQGPGGDAAKDVAKRALRASGAMGLRCESAQQPDDPHVPRGHPAAPGGLGTPKGSTWASTVPVAAALPARYRRVLPLTEFVDGVFAGAT